MLGLINNVRTSIKNIGFENIILTDTANSGEYFGVIASNNGEIKNLNFNNIEVFSENLRYVGTIGGMPSGTADEISLDNVKIHGRSYVGGAIGYVNISVETTISNITGDDVNVNSNGDNVGGLLGYAYGQYTSFINMKVLNSSVAGKNNTGGAIGYTLNNGISNITVEGSDIGGESQVGGIAGYATSSSKAFQYMVLESSNVTGSGSNIGGIIGSVSSGNHSYWVVNGSEIYATGVNSQNTGGLLGCGNWTGLSLVQVVDSEIISSGNRVGGFIGGNIYDSTQISVGAGFISGSTVLGDSDVGGSIGYTAYGSSTNLYINAEITSTVGCAGGIMGYANNTNMTASRYVINISNTMVLDAKIEAPTNAGGLIGNVVKEIYRDQSFYYNNYIDADVTSENTSTGSLIIGGRPDENDYIDNTYVYRYSTLNGNYVYATNDNIEDEQYLVRSDLEQQSIYTTEIGLTTNWSYASLPEGKYPKIADRYLYMPQLQTGVDLPVDPEITELSALSVGDEDNTEVNGTKNGATSNGLTNGIAENTISTKSIETLPTWTVYSISIDEVNIDFSSIPEGVSFTCYVNGEEKDTVELTKKSYTFKYNYQDTLEIKLANGQDEETITINPDDVRSEVSLIGANNAYLLGTNLYINGELQQGEYVNVYDSYALNSSGQVVDIATKQTSGEEVTTTLQQITTPLYTYDYKGSKIEVYGTYSTVDGNVKSQIYNVRNGQFSAIASNVDMKIGNSIIDNYNDKEYQTILNTSGELVDLKEQLQYPNNFLSNNIKQIVQNTDAESPEMMVLYNTGKVIVFNYVTGNVVYENDEKADSGLANYLTRSFSNIWSDYEDRWQEYAKSKELEAKLAELPVEEAIKENTIENITSSENNTIANNNSNENTLINVNTNTNSTNSNNTSGNLSTDDASSNTNTNTLADNSYITVYNADTGEYEVYSEDEILSGEEENPVSETTKIKENGLESVYNYDTNEESKPQANGAIIVVSIIAVAIIALVILRKVIVKNNNKKEKSNKK